MIRLASPMATAELQTRGPLYKPATPVQRKEQEGIGSQIAGKVTEKVVEKGLEELAAKTALTAAGTAVGGPVGGMVGEAVGEVAGPTIASLLKGMFFNKGGYVNGPLSMQNISKIKYKQSGGKISEEVEVKYSGPLANKGV